MTLSTRIEERLGQIPQGPLTVEAHGPCMNCSFKNEALIEFYQWLFGVMSPETYAELDRVVMRQHGVTHYDHFLPRYDLPAADFLDTEKNAFWCFKTETFIAALREVLGDRVS